MKSYMALDDEAVSRIKTANPQLEKLLGPASCGGWGMEDSQFHGETHRNRVVKYGNMIYKWRVLKEKTTFLMEVLVDFFHL